MACNADFVIDDLYMLDIAKFKTHLYANIQTGQRFRSKPYLMATRLRLTPPAS